VDVKLKIKMLVQQAVEAYLREQLHKGKSNSIAILLCYESPKPSEILETILPLFHSYDVTLLTSKEWIPFLKEQPYILLEEMSHQQLWTFIEQTSMLVIPAASYHLIAKLALTMDDELAAWLAIQYQLAGKPVVIANNNVELNVYQQILAPYSVQERLLSYIRQIQSDQVKWVSLNKLCKSVEDQWHWYEEKKSIILAKHIETAHRHGLKKIGVPANSQVTPAAKDLAKELSIQITK
jgi:hypothetical protein